MAEVGSKSRGRGTKLERRPWLWMAVVAGVGSLGSTLNCLPGNGDSTPIEFGNPEPNRPTGDPDASPPGPEGGLSGDLPDEKCPLTTQEKEWTWTSSSIVRSILIHDSVFVVSDNPPPTIPLRAFSRTTGAEVARSDVQRPDGPSTTHYPRLQAVLMDGKDHLIVSYLRRRHVDGVGNEQETPGGIAWVGPIEGKLPASASLVPGVDDSVDGVFRLDGARSVVLTRPSLSSQQSIIHRIAYDPNTRLRILDSTTITNLPPAQFERAGAVLFRDALYALIRYDETGAAQGMHQLDGHYLRTEDDLATLPAGRLTTVGATVTWAPLSWKNGTDDVNGPTFFAVDAAGVVTRYTPELDRQKRDLTVLPQGSSAAPSSAKMVHTNGPHGSIVFPGFRNGAPRLFRVRIFTGALEEWLQTAADTPDAMFGWSALDADRGLVCYASASNVVRCGCMNSVFKPVY